jgi:cytochrome P450
VFNNPEVFDPSRFLNENGVLVKSNQNIVFGIGKIFEIN